MQRARRAVELAKTVLKELRVAREERREYVEDVKQLVGELRKLAKL